MRKLQRILLLLIPSFFILLFVNIIYFNIDKDNAGKFWMSFDYGSKSVVRDVLEKSSNEENRRVSTIKSSNDLLQSLGGISTKNVAVILKTASTRNPYEPRRICKPQKNILFLKTHKTASSTMINMLQRFGDKYNLSFVLPFKYNLLGWPNSFKPKYALPPSVKGYNILCNHARYNRTSMRKILPEDVVSITILREPVHQFESAFKYMNMASYLKLINKTDPLKYFVSHPSPLQILKNATHSQATYLAWNSMSYDLGLEWKDFQNERKILEKIHSIENEFSVIMIAEYFEESLILLKRKLCWQLEDILFFTMNQRPKKLKRQIADPTLAANIRKWNRADAMLYDYFNQSLWRKIAQQGPSFYKELKLLKTKNQEMKDLCLEDNYVRDKSVGWFEVKGFTLRASALNNPLCRRLVTPELKFTEILRKKHKKMIRWIEPTTTPRQKELKTTQSLLKSRKRRVSR